MFHRRLPSIDPFASDRLDQPPRGLLAFYRRFVDQIWPWFAGLALIGGSLSIINAAMFAYVGVVIDHMETATGPAGFLESNLNLLIWLTVLVLVIIPILVALHVAVLHLSISPAFNSLIRWQTHRYLLRQSVGFFQDDFAGRLAQKIMQTSLAMRRSMVSLLDAVWFVLVFCASALVILAEFDTLATLPLAIWLALYSVIIFRFVPRIQKSSAAASEANSALTGRIVDSFSNIQTVKLFGHASREDGYARAGMAEQTAKLTVLMGWMARFDITITLLNGVLFIAHGALVLWLWSVGTLSVGAVAASIGLVMRVINMSHWIMFTASEIAENIGVVREGAEAIAQPHSVLDRDRAPDLAVDRGEIRFESIGFGYAQQDAPSPVIRNLSLVMAPGEKVGLVGPSGAGKSTLVNLLLRFHDLQTGRILIDDQDISQVGQESLRAHIGVVTQDTSLLHRSVLDNIRYGRPEASLEDTIAAAQKAQAHDFILGLEDGHGRMGYEAHVGERGVKLSGGQRQRIAIARVLLKDAPILILDEATSALDSTVESAIQEQLFNLMAGKTVIAIAHRLSTIAAMDRLVILDEGRIVETGTHRELLNRGGVYAALWARQSAGFIA